MLSTNQYIRGEWHMGGRGKGDEKSNLVNIEYLLYK